MSNEVLTATAAKILTRIVALKSESADTLDALQITAQETLDAMVLNGLPATADTRDRALEFVVTVYRAAAEVAA